MLANGTTLAEHTAGATITNISDYVGWGQSSTEEVTLEPGMWVLDNYGTKLIALIYNGKCFEWDSTVANATECESYCCCRSPYCIKTYVGISGRSSFNFLWN